MSAEDTAPPPAGPSPALDDVGSSDKGEDTEVDAVTGLPVSFSGVFNTRVTDTNVPTVLSKLCLLYTSPSPRDLSTSRMPSSA